MSILLFYFSNIAYAQDGIVVDRPSVGTASSVVSKGTVQIETGLQIDSNPALDCNSCLYSFESASYSSPTMLRFGLHDRFEIRPYSSIIVAGQETQVLQGSGLQGKVSVYAPEDKPLSLSILGSGDLEAAGGTLLLDFWGGSESKLQWGGWINVGNTTSYEDGATSFTIIEGFGVSLPNAQGIFIESTTSFEADNISSSVEGGFYKTYDNFQWDVYALSSITEKNAWQLATGFAWRIK